MNYEFGASLMAYELLGTMRLPEKEGFTCAVRVRCGC